MSDQPVDSDVDTSFVPELDARQRAMLAEMGIKVWAPKPAAALPPVVEAATAPVAAGPAGARGQPGGCASARAGGAG